MAAVSATVILLGLVAATLLAGRLARPLDMLCAEAERIRNFELDGPVEWTRSNKHTGVRHMPVRLVARA